jgi:ABC-type branched-subunit amino acid transport system ATPase component
MAGNLSLGQQRILEIGMALMPDPDLFILDEATSGINPTFLETIKVRLRQLNYEKGKTFIIIEHNMSFIEDMCSRVLVLDNGEMLAEGTPEEVINNPQVVEAYIGSQLEVDEDQNEQ